MYETNHKQYTLSECKISIIFIVISIILAAIGSIYLALYAEYASYTRAFLSFVCNLFLILYISTFIANLCNEKNKAIAIAALTIILQLIGFTLFVTIKNIII